MSKKLQKNSEQLPVNSARSMAFISAGMSICFALFIYFFFLKDIFTGGLALIVLFIMLALTAISSVVALNNVRKKIICTSCNKPYFSIILAMFAKPASCAACQKPTHVDGR